MANENPYKLPCLSGETTPNPALLFWSIAAVFISSLAGGLAGTMIGATLGSLAPGYYRSVFSNGQSPDFDPLAVGIGQGLTQGIVFGGVIGLVVVAMFYWYRGRAI